MNSLQSSLYTAALALWIFSSGLLRERSRGRGISFSYFTVFLAAQTAGLVFELLMAHPQIPLKALWLGLRMATSLTVAPVLWLAVQEIIEGRRPTLTSLGRLPLMLAIIGVVFTFPLIADAHLGTTYYNPAHPTSALYSRIIHTTMLGCIGVFAWQVPFYLWRCRQLLARQFSSGETSHRFRLTGGQTWLHLPLLIVFTTWVLGLLRTVHCISHAPQGFGLLFSAADVGVTTGAIYAMVRRVSWLSSQDLGNSLPVVEAVVTPLPPTQDITPDLTSAVVTSESIATPLVENPVATPTPVSSGAPAAPEIAPAPETKYARSVLPGNVRERIKKKLHASLSTRKVHSDSLLTLRTLSTAIKENVHYVSQVINQDLNSNFYQLVNQYRIEQAKKQLIDTPQKNVLEIALAVGFNSKSTFNTAFRRNTGVTPSEFRKSGEAHGRDKSG